MEKDELSRLLQAQDLITLIRISSAVNYDTQNETDVFRLANKLIAEVPHSDLIRAVRQEVRGTTAPKKKSLLPKILFGILGFALVGGILLFILNSPKADPIATDACPFTENNQYHILLYPFLFSGEAEESKVESVVSERLTKISEKDDLDLEVKIDRSSNTDFEMSFETAREAGKACLSHLSIWGNVQGTSDSSTVNVKYVTSSQNNDSDLAGDSELRTISSLTEGAIAGKIEDIVYWALGLRSFSKQTYDQAITYFNKIRTDESSHKSLVLRAMAECLEKMDRNDEAIVLYEKALEEVSDDPVALYNKGVLNFRIGKVEEALENITAASKLSDLPQIQAGAKHVGRALARVGKDHYDTEKSFTEKKKEIPLIAEKTVEEAKVEPEKAEPEPQEEKAYGKPIGSTPDVCAAVEAKNAKTKLCTKCIKESREIKGTHILRTQPVKLVVTGVATHSISFESTLRGIRAYITNSQQKVSKGDQYIFIDINGQRMKYDVVAAYSGSATLQLNLEALEWLASTTIKKIAIAQDKNGRKTIFPATLSDSRRSNLEEIVCCLNKNLKKDKVVKVNLPDANMGVKK